MGRRIILQDRHRDNSDGGRELAEGFRTGWKSGRGEIPRSSIAGFFCGLPFDQRRELGKCRYAFREFAGDLLQTLRAVDQGEAAGARCGGEEDVRMKY